MHRRLPAPRLGVRALERPAAVAPRLRAGRDLSRSDRRRHRSCRRRLSSLRCWPTTDPLYVAYHDEEWGRPGQRRARPVRAALPRGVPVRALVADDPAQARELPARRSRTSIPTPSRASASATSKRLLGRRRHRPPPRQDRSGDRERARRARRCAKRERRCTSSSGRTRPRTTRAATTADWHAQTPESKELSKRLKAAGFRFVGPTTVWAAMQACGIVNDHLATCWVREEVEGPRDAGRQLSVVLR